MSIGRAFIQGSLLVAVPLLDDPNFHRSVVYVLQHDDDGALGVIINRPTPTRSGLDNLFGMDAWLDELSPPRVVFEGGPVQINSLIAIAATDHATITGPDAARPGVASPDVASPEIASPEIASPEIEGFAPLSPGLGTVDLTVLPASIAAYLQHLRVFRGYSGWGPGQLEDELDQGAWLPVAADRGDLFTTNPADLWRNVLRRAGG
ncbi:MAG TPA: YqgE/AlgH family protein, partial [Ilumatobacteraceae bacterium]|nr:YqgE/AlgH family protein [Ilumatobacteraceae bacterium]